MADDQTTNTASKTKGVDKTKAESTTDQTVATQQVLDQAGVSDTTAKQTGSQAFDKSGTVTSNEASTQDQSQAFDKTGTSTEASEQAFAKSGTQDTSGITTEASDEAFAKSGTQATTGVNTEASQQTTDQLSEMLKGGTSNMTSEEVSALVNEARRQGIAETEIPAWLEAASQNVVGMAATNAQTPTEGYGGPMVADFSADQNAFFDQLRSYLAGTPSQGGAAIQGAADYAAAPAQAVGTERLVDESGRLGAISDYTNPYAQQALMPAIRAAQEQRDAEFNAIRARQTQGGSAYGDARHGIADAVLADRTVGTIGDITAQGMDRAWKDAMAARTGDVSRMFEADQLNAGFNEAALRRGFEGTGAMQTRSAADQDQTLAGLKELFAAGTAQQGNEQARLDAAKSEFLRTQGADQDKLKTFASIVGGVPYGKKETTSSEEVGSQSGTKAGSQVGATTEAGTNKTTGVETGSKVGTSDTKVASEESGVQTGSKTGTQDTKVASQEAGTQTGTKTGTEAESGTSTGKTTGTKVGTQESQESGTQQSQQESEQHAVETLEKELLGLTESETDTKEKSKTKSKDKTTGTTTAEAADTSSSDLIQLAGTVGAALISDRRAKTDIADVGRLFDGTAVYRFRYIADGPDGPFHIGLMADEVEEFAPEAVIEGSDGIKRVDYRKATERAIAATVE